MRLARRPLLAAVAVVPVLLSALAVYSCRRGRADLGNPAGVLAALHEAGLDYEGQAIAPGSTVTEPGYYLRHPGDERPWAELAAMRRAPFPEQWRGYVRLHWLPERFQPLDRPGAMRLDRLLIVGDPVEVTRIAEALR